MLRLQLLPREVFEPARVKKALAVWVVLLLAMVGGTLGWFLTCRNAMQNMDNQKTVAAGFESQIGSLDGEIAAVVGQIQPVDNKKAYIEGLRDYGDVWPERMRALAPFIYSRVEVLSCRLTTAGVELQVRTKTTEDVARMLMNLRAGYEAGLFAQDSVNVSGLTGWPNRTSPVGLGPGVVAHMDLNYSVPGMVAVNSNTNVAVGAAAGGGGAGPADGPPGAEAAGAPVAAAAGSSAAAGAPPTGSGGEAAGGASGGGGGGGGGRMRAAAVARYIKESVEPGPQPYLLMSVSARWATPIPAPDGGGGGGGGGGGAPMPGMPPGAEAAGAPPPGGGAPAGPDAGSAGVAPPA